MLCRAIVVESAVESDLIPERDPSIFARFLMALIRRTPIPGVNRLAAWIYRPSRAATRYIAGVIRRGDGLLMHLDSRNHIDWAIMFSGDYEPHLGGALHRWLKPGSVFVDVGANIGRHALTGASVVGEAGTVLAFEPNPPVREVLEENVRLNGFTGRVRIFSCALGAATSRSALRVPSTEIPEASNMGLASLVDFGLPSDSVEVPVQTLDDVFEESGLVRCDVVKIDVQGYEAQVLAGMRTVLLRHRPRVVFEWESRAWRQAGVEFADVGRFLDGLGYLVFRLGHDGVRIPMRDIHEISRHEDLIAMHREDLAA